MINKYIILTFYLLFYVDGTNSDVLYDLFYREDPCAALCEKIANKNHLKSCERGCRFFNLIDTGNNFNGTKDACESSCVEAYVENEDRRACNEGCESMAKQRITDLFSLVSIAMLMEEELDTNDAPDNDILTDPGLRKELLPRWWDYDGFKLPETHIKTVPIDSENIDYTIPSDYGANDVDQSGSDWLRCASRHTGIPRSFLASVIVAAALIILWLYLSPIKANGINNRMKLIVPDESTMVFKVPPPKYDEHIPNGKV